LSPIRSRDGAPRDVRHCALGHALINMEGDADGERLKLDAECREFRRLRTVGVWTLWGPGEGLAQKGR